ncbi:MAG TPA: ATP-binding protein [Gemmatimonadaceae bacterium]|nr:ATP-binding protein [Gemmatimonadaceae bacterium]
MASSRLRLSLVALGVMLLFALAGLYAIDQLLSQTGQAETEVEAAESAAVVQEFLSVHAEALQSIRGLYLDTTRAVSAEQFHTLASMMNQYASSLHRIWVADSSGVIQYQYVQDSTLRPLMAGLDIDTSGHLGVRLAARRARTTHRIQMSIPGRLLSGHEGFVIIEPMYVGQRLVGFAGETITSSSLLDNVQQRLPRARGRVALIADGGDTVTSSLGSAPASSSYYTAMTDLTAPGMHGWRLVVMRPARDERVRVLLWGVGLAIIGTLFVVLLQERWQSVRLAERSTELERLSSELLQANRAKSEFLANVSHELRTPLNAIVGFIDLLRDGMYGELTARQIGPAERIASSANHLRQLVDQVLDIAKMAAGRVEIHLETVDLHVFVVEAASEVEALISERGLNLSIAVSPSLPRIRTDPLHLRQIVMNLLANAIKFTHSGGIAIRAHLANSRDEPVQLAEPTALARPDAARADRLWIALQIADSGIGIIPDDRERIFEEFEQVHAGPRGDSAQRGTGLGLAISRRLARLLGGDLTVDSELGKGSTFTVWLAVDPAAFPAEELRGPGSAQHTGDGRVEDDASSPAERNGSSTGSTTHSRS